MTVIRLPNKLMNVNYKEGLSIMHLNINIHIKNNTKLYFENFTHLMLLKIFQVSEPNVAIGKL